MVVKLLSNENLDELEKEINDYISITIESIEGMTWPEGFGLKEPKFNVDIKVVPGYNSVGTDDDNYKMYYHEPPYFIAVIQY